MGPRTDPCVTTIGEDVIGDLEFPMETNWRRFDKYELNQESAMPVIPKDVFESFDENRVVDSVEGDTHIEGDENSG